MITKDNLKQVLENLGFKNKNENYVKTINNYTLLIDYKNQSINYPKEIKIHDKTTSNFSHPENFVVFECVHRLLEKGYKAEYLELEPKWNLGRDKKGGKADILVKDNENNPYLIIECKTTDSKNSEFIKEWNRMQEDGGQLFSYFQQEKGVKYLCLYTSDFSDKLEYKNYIIQAYDNEEYLKEKELQNSYKKSNNNIELFKTWKESYELQYFKQGIFEENVNAYKILEITPTFDNLKELKEEGKYHEFAKILRKHNISGKENAFDKLVNIFLCKIYDETFNKNNLKFGYFGVMADTYANMQDRLMWLYKEAMKEFLGEKITFVSNEDIEKDFKQLKIKTLKEVMQNYIKELKFYSNNDFAFLEVHNKELFLKNALVLKEIVELFANYKLTQNSTNQFLGNLFELFLQKGMKQDEGQFFTPIQICEFIMYSLPLQEMLSKSSKALRVIDYACGAGHFLNTYANELKRYLTEDELKEHYKNIYGIEKEYRLSKVSKVSSAMYGQNEINILYADALASFELANTNNLEGEKAKPQIESNSFDLLIANPPYSVKGFLETLSDKSKNTYKLFNDDINIETNNSIECFFCERANQILNDNAKAAIILPSSILNKDSIYKNTREILFQNFDFIAIVELGNQTFGATGTNTIILFLRKKETFKQENHLISQDYSLIKERIEAENLKDNENFYQNYLSAYCDFRKFDKELYSNFLNGNLDSKLAELEAFKDYRNAFRQTSDYKKLKESKIYKESKDKQDLEDKAFLAYTQAIEKDKLLYFCLSLNQEVLIIKSPSDIKEQKKFLGYEWSNRKGDEGLKELHEPYLSPLFERGNPQNETKLNTLICKAFLKTLSDIPKDLQGYASKARLIDMMDFEKVEFNKAISLNPSNSTQSEMSNPFINSKFELVRLKDFVLDIQTAKRPSGGVGKYENGALSLGGEHIDNKSGYIKLDNPKYVPIEFYESFALQDKGIVKQFDILICKDGALTGKIAMVRNEFIRKSAMINEHIFLLRCDNIAKQKYLFYILHSYSGQQALKSKITGSAQGGINKTNLESILIPNADFEIQKQIVAECEKVEEQYNTIRMSVEEYQNLIKAILQKCGIIDDGGGYELNSILENLQKLEFKLDFNLLFSFIDDFTNARQEDLKKFKEFVKNIKAILGTFSTPPKQGWNKEKLNEIVSIQSGGTPDRKIKEYWNGNINWVKSEVCQNCYVYDYQVKEKITELGLQKSSAKLLKKETTLIALVGATIGKIGFLTFESATNQNITGLYPK
ncbi:restriction endonuclease, partial [Campylobacter coli]|nr:restriction endonuclease [Campylobacter coli]